MTQPDLSVDLAALRACAERVRGAAEAIEAARAKEAPELSASRGDPRWATVVAMPACAAAVDGQLRGGLAQLQAYAEALDAAAREYGDADGRAARRQPHRAV